MNRDKVISSMIYKFIERFSFKGVGLIIGIILARLLLPEEFGKLAIITVFTTLATTIIQSGLNTALVHRIHLISITSLFFIQSINFSSALEYRT